MNTQDFTNVCAPGYVPVRNRDHCKLIASKFGKWHDWHPKGSKKMPSGCYKNTYNGNVHFNTATETYKSFKNANQRKICMRMPPTSSPTISPSAEPTTGTPTGSPTGSPTSGPTHNPTPAPSNLPSRS